MMNLPIYLDYAAATPLDPNVLNVMLEVLKQGGTFGNPSAKDHIYGWQAAEVVEEAREKIAKVVGCTPLNLIFTSGASESNNFAILGLARANPSKKHIISSTVEHKSILSALDYLKEKHGYRIDLLNPDENGVIKFDSLKSAIRDDTLMVSICHGNSVLGVINDIHAMATLCKEHNIIFHTDCAQSAGWFDLNLDDSDITLASLTPEKIYGPKGVGALYIKREAKVELEPLIFGGGQERNLRGGTVATHQVAAMGEAFYQMSLHAKDDSVRLHSYRNYMIEQLKTLDFVKINGDTKEHLPTILSVTFKGVDPVMLIPSLTGVAVSTGSACSSSSLKPSYVLKAIGLSDKDARSSLRISIGRFTTKEQIEQAVKEIKEQVTKLHNTNLWQVK